MDAPSEIKEQNSMDDAATNAEGAGGGDRENLEAANGPSAEESQARVNGQEEENEEGEEDAADEEKEEESEQSEDEEEEVEEEGGASDEENDYEAQRQRNIERNQAMLRQLGLLVDPLAMAAPFGTSPSSTSTSTTASSTSSSSSSSALLPLSDAAPVAAGFSLQTPKRKYKPRQKRNVDTPTRTSSRLQTKSRRSYAENSFFKTLPPEEQAQILAAEKKARKKARREREDAEEAEGEETEEQRNARNSNKWVGSRLYDSDRGITCHQCRQKTVDEKTTCANEFRIHTPARHHYCRRCLWNRYGEALDEVRKDPVWLCPSCRGVCNCSFCRKKRGQAPTGVLDTAILQKYSSVAEYLHKDRQEKPAVSEEELKEMKENIEKEIKEGIRPSAPITTSASVQAEEISADLKGDLYYVEAIVEHRSTPRGLEYLIKWLGYGYELNTWEPAAHLNCPHLIKEYHVRNKLPLHAKRGRKKKIVDDPSATNGDKAADAAEEKQKGKEEDEGEEEAEEEEEEEEKIAEWQTRRPGRPKGRGRGRPRLVVGTGRGPRRSDGAGDDEDDNGAADATTTTAEQRANGKKKRKAKEALPAQATKKSRTKAAKKSAKNENDEKEDDEEETKTKGKGKKKANSKVAKASKGGKAAATKKGPTSAKKKEAAEEAKQDVRKSPRRKQEAQPEASKAAVGRKSPRLAKRARAGRADDADEEAEPVVAKTKVAAKPTGAMKRKKAESDGEDEEKAGVEEDERPKTLYWDEPVEKGKRRRSAPILLSDNFIILGNGEVRGEAQRAHNAGRKSTSTGKSNARTATEKEKEEKVKEKKTRKTSTTKETKKGEATKQKKKTKKNETKKRRGKPEEEKKREESEEKDEEEPERPLYWETAVPRKRPRNPNMAYFTDFLPHSGPPSAKRKRKSSPTAPAK